MESSGQQCQEEKNNACVTQKRNKIFLLVCEFWRRAIVCYEIKKGRWGSWVILCVVPFQVDRHVDPGAHYGWQGDPSGRLPVQAHQGGRAAGEDNGAVQHRAGKTKIVLPRQTGIKVNIKQWLHKVFNKNQMLSLSFWKKWAVV